MKDALVVIPARLGSTRFPRKVLADLGGRPVAAWCARAAMKAGVGPVVVATDSPRAARAFRALGFEPILTPSSCPSGSDRVWEAARRGRWRSFRFIVNLQGDEPLIRPSTIRRVVSLLRRPGVDIATAVVPITDPREAKDPNVVKAVLAKGGRCLYFSRSPVPFDRSPNGTAPVFYKHIGIYAYRRAALERFVSLPPSPLERRECLEQLRALEAGLAIAAVVVKDKTVAIDVPADLRRASRVLAMTFPGDIHHA